MRDLIAVSFGWNVTGSTQVGAQNKEMKFDISMALLMEREDESSQLEIL